MRLLFVLLIALSSLTDELKWMTDLDKAKQEATTADKAILLYFSGSDWCSSCMRMKKEFISHPDFVQYATEKLVLVNADFPRNKANQLEKAQADKNAALAEKYDPKGVFPMLILMDKNGKVMKEWAGVPKGSAPDFVKELTTAEQSCHASK
jgi:thioredoxin-related protein